MSERLLSPREVAELTGLSYHAVLRAIRAGELPAFGLRGRLRIDPCDYRAWLEGNRVAAPRAEQQHERRQPRRRSAPVDAGRGSLSSLREIEREVAAR